jgi:hypothetical protein
MFPVGNENVALPGLTAVLMHLDATDEEMDQVFSLLAPQPVENLPTRVKRQIEEALEEVRIKNARR